MAEFANDQQNVGFFTKTKNAFLSTLQSAPPKNRKIDEGFVLLGRKVRGVLQPVGAFSPELYVMAKAGRLAWQIENNQARLNRDDGTPKTAFELAMIPHVSFDKIGKHFRNAITFNDKASPRYKTRATLPAPVYKLRIMDEFLPDLEKMGLEKFETDTLAAVDDIKINLRNRKQATTTRERVLHYTSQWMAFILSLVVGMEVATVVGFGFPMILLPFAAGYLANKCAKDFGMFDLAESLLRDLGWMFDKDYAWKGKLSFRKSVETTGYLAAAGYAIYLTTSAVWASTLALPIWGAALTIGAPAMLVTAASLAAASIFTLTAGASAWFGASYTMRYFWPFSFFDNAIDPNEVKSICNKLPIVVSISDEKRRCELSHNVRLERTVTPARDRHRRAGAQNNEPNGNQPETRQSMRLLEKKRLAKGLA